MVGGPGSGKTELLVNLAVEWIRSGNDPTRLVLIVRSRASAVAAEARIAAKLPEAHPGIFIQTHERLARTVLARLGRGNSPGQVLSRAGEWLAMGEALRRAAPSLPRLGPLAEEPSSTNDALAVVSAAKRALVGPGLLAERLRDAPDTLREIAVVAANYQDVLDEMESHDPRDGHGLAIDALVSDRGAMSGWADLLLVDEAEDLSPAQWLLLRELSARLTPPQRLVMAGHWSESTPGFRGVSSESSSRPFEEYFPSELRAEDWVLAGALPPWTVEAAASLGLDLRESAPTREVLEPDFVPRAAFRVAASAAIWVASDETEEALAVAREILRARLQGELDFSDVALLVRSSNRQLAPIRAALNAVGVPYRISGGGEGAGSPLVGVALNWLRVLSSPADSDALLEALATGPRAVPPAALAVLRRAAGRRNLSPARVFWDWVSGTGGTADLGGRERAEGEQWELLKAAGNPWLEVAASAPQAPGRQLAWDQVRRILSQVELAAGLSDRALRDLEAAGILADLSRCAEATADMQSRLGRTALTLPDWLELIRRAVRYAGGEVQPASDELRQEVSVMTIRQAKGRRWSRVFLCGCALGTIPGPGDAGGLLNSEEVQEMVRCVPEMEDVLSTGDRQRDAEARLFLVGLTRASGETTCTWPRRSQSRAAERSPFLTALVEAGIKETAAPQAQLVQREDLVTELALATPQSAPAVGGPSLNRRAAELLLALGPWDPVADGAADLGSVISLSATSVAAWLACPRQYLAHLLGPASDSDVNLTLGLQAHRLLEMLHRERPQWQDDPLAFRKAADVLVRDRVMPEVRAELGNEVEVLFVNLWLDRLLTRWERQIVAAGRDRVGEPIAAEVFFDVPRQGWHLRGKVDALWRHPGGEVELIDYKTSKDDLSEVAVRKEVFGVPPDGPKQWQLPIYQIAARSGGLAEELPDEVPALMRNWYVGVDPGRRDPDPIPASGFRMVGGDAEPSAVGTLSDGELDRIERQLDQLALVILRGRFPAQPRHQQRTCRDGRAGCSVSFWCDGEESVGHGFPTPNPEL